MSSELYNPQKKIIPFAKIGDHAEDLKTQEQKSIVLTSGVFDILHSGHLKALTHHRNLGDNLIVGIDSDSLVKRRKGTDPILDQENRSFLIAGFECVNFVTIFDEIYDLVEAVKPNILVMSRTSHLKPEERTNEIELVRSYDGKLEIFDEFSQLHSSDLVKKIKHQL